MIQLFCGHSLCIDCFNQENKCVECEKEFDKNKKMENIFLSNVIARYNYAEQQINSDIGLVIKTLSKYLSQ